MNNDDDLTYVWIEISWFSNNYYIFIFFMTKIKKITLFDVERITNPEFSNIFFCGKFRISSVFKLRSNIFEKVLHKYPNTLWNSKCVQTNIKNKCRLVEASHRNGTLFISLRFEDFECYLQKIIWRNECFRKERLSERFSICYIIH